MSRDACLSARGWGQGSLSCPPVPLFMPADNARTTSTQTHMKSCFSYPPSFSLFLSLLRSYPLTSVSVVPCRFPRPLLSPLCLPFMTESRANTHGRGARPGVCLLPPLLPSSPLLLVCRMCPLNVLCRGLCCSGHARYVGQVVKARRYPPQH